MRDGLRPPVPGISAYFTVEWGCAERSFINTRTGERNQIPSFLSHLFRQACWTFDEWSMNLCPWWAQLPKQRVPENADELAFKVNWETDVQPLWDH